MIHTAGKQYLLNRYFGQNAPQQYLYVSLLYLGNANYIEIPSAALEATFTSTVVGSAFTGSAGNRCRVSMGTTVASFNDYWVLSNDGMKATYQGELLFTFSGTQPVGDLSGFGLHLNSVRPSVTELLTRDTLWSTKFVYPLANANLVATNTVSIAPGFLTITNL